MTNLNINEMLQNKELKNGMIKLIAETVLNWNEQRPQGKIETNITKVIEKTINTNMIEYFNDFQIYFIENNFSSADNFLTTFYKENPEISNVLDEILNNGITPIKTIINGGKSDKSLDYYNHKLDKSFKNLVNLSSNLMY